MLLATIKAWFIHVSINNLFMLELTCNIRTFSTSNGVSTCEDNAYTVLYELLVMLVRILSFSKTKHNWIVAI